MEDLFFSVGPFDYRGFCKHGNYRFKIHYLKYVGRETVMVNHAIINTQKTKFSLVHLETVCLVNTADTIMKL